MVIFLDKGLIRRNLYSKTQLKKIEDDERAEELEKEKKKLEDLV